MNTSSNDSICPDRLTGETTRVSVSSSGRQGGRPAIIDPVPDQARITCKVWREPPAVGDPSADCGRWITQLSMTSDGSVVVFESSLIGLVDGEPPDPPLIDPYLNRPFQVYAHDLRTGETVRLSENARGEPANDATGCPEVSGDGRLVAFWSMASNLVPGIDPYGVTRQGHKVPQLFLLDRDSGGIRHITPAVDGGPSNGQAMMPDISADGRIVVFVSEASDLVVGDRNGAMDVFAQRGGTAREIETERRTLTGCGKAQPAS